MIVDYIIVGQGIGGTACAYYLMEAGQSVMVIDPGGTNATQVAAGNINPLTGRGYTKSWMIDELLLEANAFYKGLGRLIGHDVINDQSIYRTIRSIQEENKWMSRLHQEGYEAYINDIADHIEGDDLYKEPPLGFGKVSNALQINTRLTINGFRDLLESREMLIVSSFNYKELIIHDDGGLIYQGIKARSIVFAEGAGVMKNPFFNTIPIEPTKGEVILIDLDEKFKSNVKDNVFISPYGDYYWVGSDYQKQFDESGPTKKGYDYLIDKLNRSIHPRYKVVDHLAGIRPCTRDRRPVIGRHPQFHSLLLFNGLGTKGTSLAPYFARHLVEHLIYGYEINSEVDLRRYM